MESLAGLLLTAVFIPLLAFVVLALAGSKLGKPRAGYVAVAGIATSLALSTTALLQWLGMPEAKQVGGVVPFLEWAHLGTVPVVFGVNVDSLTVIMFFMVTLVSTCIFVFSLGYMAGHSDEVDGKSKYHRFFCYLSLFAFSMLGLVVAPSILFMFIFWELVGVCSYFLIGFYFHKKSASNAAIKAFVVNRVGDFGFLIGLMMAFYYLGDVSLDGTAATFKSSADEFVRQGGDLAAFHPREGVQADQLFTPGPLGVMMATWMGICLFCGAIGKSAQFPLQVWLPDAMEGPTPVSALIHAATMVAAGVYLVARIFTLLTPGAAMFIATIGCITLTIAALVAIVQTDIKRVLAYSTLSQLGYMIFAMGIGAWIGALFHLLTHAFFKALMFLGSGQVIEGCHHEQDMTKMGGLRKKMPVTCWTFLVGVLAISGVGLPWLKFGVGGYYSKDEILAVAYYRAFGGAHDGAESHASLASTDPAHAALPAAEAAHLAASGGVMEWLPKVLCVFAIVTAFVTPFYMMRCWWMAFMGKPRDEHVYAHAHEVKLMYGPLVVLAVGTFLASWFLFRPMVAAAFTSAPLATGFSEEAMHGVEHAVHGALTLLVWPSFIVGFLLAWWIYKGGLAKAERIKAAWPRVYTLLWRKYYFDEVYDTLFVKGVSRVIAGICGAIDRYFIDKLVDFSAWVTRVLSYISGNRLDMNGMNAAPRGYDGLVVLLLITGAFGAAWKLSTGDDYAPLWIGVILWVVLGVDGLVNDLAQTAAGFATALRRPQSGRIRMYVLPAAAAAAIGVIAVLWFGAGAVQAGESVAR